MATTKRYQHVWLPEHDLWLSHHYLDGNYKQVALKFRKRFGVPITYLAVRFRCAKKGLRKSTDHSGLKITEFAELMELSPAAVRKMIDAGVVTAVNKFRYWLIPLEELDRLMPIYNPELGPDDLIASEVGEILGVTSRRANTLATFGLLSVRKVRVFGKPQHVFKRQEVMKVLELIQKDPVLWLKKNSHLMNEVYFNRLESYRENPTLSRDVSDGSGPSQLQRDSQVLRDVSPLPGKSTTGNSVLSQ